jgi:Animal haem peroxidase
VSEDQANRLFPDLPARVTGQPRADELGAVGGPMDGGYTHVSNMEIPAGYTYFAQFVLHDLTSEPVPRLNLWPVYGAGPRASSHLYEADGYLRVGHLLGHGTACDLPRDHVDRAVIADPRNDRTIMLAQLHAAFLQFHNLVLAATPCRDRAVAFELARAQVEHEYRSLVANDLLPRIVGPQMARRAISMPAGFCTTPERQVSGLPLEFTIAVGRVGHAMVQPRYRLNDDFHAVLFQKGGASSALTDLRGQVLGELAQIDWAHFFPVGNPCVMQRAAKFNARICRPLFEVPAPGGDATSSWSLPYRTLLGDRAANLPAGQDVASAMGISAVPDEVLWRDAPYAGAPAPLWFYVLREADHQHHGRRLGEVGGRIFAHALADGVRAGNGREHAQTRASRTLGELLVAVSSGECP